MYNILLLKLTQFLSSPKVAPVLPAVAQGAAPSPQSP